MGLSGYWRRGAKDYGWAFGIPGVLVVEVWCPLGAEPDRTPLWGQGGG